MPTTTEFTEQYIALHPSIKDCLQKCVINYSKLSRMIAKELHLEKKASMEAILIACRRYALKIQKENALEDKILEILKKGRLEIKTKIVVAIVDKAIYMENLFAIERKIRKTADVFYALEGTNVFTIIISEQYLEEIKKQFSRNILKISPKLAMIIIKSPKEMETTPGVISYLYSLFADRGINIMETISCWTDTLFIIAENDVQSVIGFLTFS